MLEKAKLRARAWAAAKAQEISQSLAPPRTQASIPAPSERWIASPKVAFVIAFGSVVIAVVLAFWPAPILESTQRVYYGPRQHIQVLVAGFWGLTLVWAYLLYHRLKMDDQKERDRIAELVRAIQHSSNFSVVKYYPSWFEKAVIAINSTHSTGTSEEQIRAIEVGLQLVLAIVAAMAREYARADDSTSYGANIMIVAWPDAAYDSIFEPGVIESLRFYDKMGGNLASLRCILYMPEGLLLRDLSAKGERQIPLIALPVPPTFEDEAGAQLALPGAPAALLTGSASVEEDTQKMVAESTDFARPIIAEMTEYFSKTGSGRNVGSFASFRIGGKDVPPGVDVPFGVLNIDSTATYLLGLDDAYYETFFALITPIVHLLVEPLGRYAALTRGTASPAVRGTPAS
jgi:hypothetical protein